MNLEEPFYCPVKKHRGKALLNCPTCPHFICDFLGQDDLKMLLPYTDNIEQVFKKGKNNMIIVEKSDGTLEKREKFDIENPTEKDLKNVEKVYVVSKSYEKKVKLVKQTERQTVTKPVKKKKSSESS